MHTRLVALGSFSLTRTRRTLVADANILAGLRFCNGSNGPRRQKSRVPVPQWFRGMYQLTQSKSGVSPLELSRRLGVQYDTAWKLEHKLMQVMKERDSRLQLTERVAIDDAYLGGERAKVPGKAGRGAPGKTPFVAAVETEHDASQPRRIVLQVVDGFTGAEIADFAKRKLAPSADVISDGRSRFPFGTEAGCSHGVRLSRGAPTRVGRGADVQMGEHDARQHRVRADRNVPPPLRQARPALPRRVPVPPQPPDRYRGHAAATRLRLAAHAAHAVRVARAT